MFRRLASVAAFLRICSKDKHNFNLVFSGYEKQNQLLRQTAVSNSTYGILNISFVIELYINFIISSFMTCCNPKSIIFPFTNSPQFFLFK